MGKSTRQSHLNGLTLQLFPLQSVRCKVISNPAKSFAMKACGDQSGILSPKNSEPRRFTSD
jgi:hypothetical protein